MRVLVVAVCCLVLVSTAATAGSLSAEELTELESILRDYETVEKLLTEGLLQLTEGQIQLMQGLIALHSGMGSLYQRTDALDYSLTRIEDAAKAEQRRTRRLILILTGVIAVETAAVIIFR